MSAIHPLLLTVHRAPPQCVRSIRNLKAYTKTGDMGLSQLLSGERRPKNDIVFHALGDTDELNAQMGIAVEQARIVGSAYLPLKLEQIQCRLCDVGACVATPLTSASDVKERYAGVFEEEYVAQLEHWIDEMDSELPPLKCFTIPSGGGFTSTHLYVARAVCRRAERSVVPLVAAGDVDGVVQRYLNRLSDFLFVSARFAAVKENREETK